MTAPTVQSVLRWFAFREDGALRRDAQGRRIVADVEGPAILTLFRAETPVRLQSGELVVPGQAVEVGFDAYAEFIAEGPGEVETLVRRCPLPTTLPASEPGTRFKGVGWLTEWEGLASVDTGGGLMPYRGYPAPFLQEAIALDGGRAVLFDDLTLSLVASFEPDDGDSLKAVGFAVKNMSAVERLKTRPDVVDWDVPVASHLNQATFTVVAPPGCTGLLIRQWYDQFHGVQRVRVLANGEFMGWWYEPVQNRDRRWGQKQFGFPILESGPVEITLDPPAGAPLWSFGPTKVWALMQGGSPLVMIPGWSHPGEPDA